MHTSIIMLAVQAVLTAATPYTICLSTTPFRASDKSVHQVIDTLLAQQPAPTKIVLTVPWEVMRPVSANSLSVSRLRGDPLDWTRTKPYTDTLLTNYVAAGADLGPVTKLTNCLPHIANGTCVVVTDDDAPRSKPRSELACGKSGTYHLGGSVSDTYRRRKKKIPPLKRNKN